MARISDDAALYTAFWIKCFEILCGLSTFAQQFYDIDL